MEYWLAEKIEIKRVSVLLSSIFIIVTLIYQIPFFIEVNGTVIETSGSNSKQFVRVDIPMKYSGLVDVPRNIEIYYIDSSSQYGSSTLDLVSKERIRNTNTSYFYGFSEIHDFQKTGTRCSVKVLIDDKTIWQLMYTIWRS